MARVQTSMEGAEVQPLGGEVCWSTVTGHSGSSPRWRRQAVANGQVHTCAEQVGGHQCRGETWSTKCLHGESCRRQPGMEGASEQSGPGRQCGQGTWSTASVTIGADQGCKGTKGPCMCSGLTAGAQPRRALTPTPSTDRAATGTSAEDPGPLQCPSVLREKA